MFDFFDENGQRVDGFVPFGDARRVREAQVIDPDFLNNVSVLMPCDVTSPLLGPTGAAHVFGPQKGATPEQIPVLDESIEHVIRMFLRGKHGGDGDFEALAVTPSAGASGGIVGAFMALFGEQTSTVSGMDFVANLTDLNEKIGQSDLIVTGEGSFDVQTL